jgi:Tol biopolymer transport system component
MRTILIVAGVLAALGQSVDREPDWRSPLDRSSNYLPRWSPDGRQFAFYRRLPEGWRMHTMDTSGGALRLRPGGGKNDYGPSWSPDGRSLAFDSDRDGGRDIYAISLDDDRVERLTDSPSRDVMPAWSPKGTEIAFVSDREDGPQVWIMNRDGGCARRVTRGLPKGGILRPAWSPDGNRIAFAAIDAATGRRRLYTVGRDGSALTAITPPADAANPSWSADGRRLVFDATPDGVDDSSKGQFELFIINADGTALRRLTNDSVNDWGPSWSPDGREVAFSRGLNDQYEVYRIDVERGTMRRVTRLVYR